MKFSTATILAVVGLVAAQLDGIPSCAVTCLNNAVTSTGKCQAGDVACLCSPANYQAIVTAGTPCVLASCGAEVAANQVLPAAGKICAAVAGGGGPASSAAAVPAVSSAVASVSSAVVASVSSRVASASSRAASITSRISQASASASATRTVVVTSAVTSRNGTSTATSTVAPVTVNGANVQGPVGVLAMLAVGALAAL
ncbi:GPI-anchored CFEM domain protein [Colletotrichum sp. SAR 10_99]|nr:GPI-anchored CFEM domain protein [Colletotrichum sp. SAR 10_96]KAI8294917.1 GPI-anchored CFEM domain protein [Colletotrichum sp. SAR 10_98]KAJ5017984.1 GPI-anchored CFEM domain protein [Colletotrichum sp. SAR 10_99]